MQSDDEELFIWKPTGKGAATENARGVYMILSDTSEQTA
jgi:hypothetical protein